MIQCIGGLQVFLPLLQDVVDEDVLVIDDADSLFDSELLIGSKGNFYCMGTCQ